MGQRKDLLKASRTAAKVGMAGSLAILVYTGMKGGRKAIRMHTWAGMGLLGFTLWHIYLYQPRKRVRSPAHAKQ